MTHKQKVSEQGQKALKKKREALKEEALVTQGVFGSPNGKLELATISKMCNENEPTYVDQNALGMAYKEGQRSIIIGIRKRMNKTFNNEVQTKADLKGKK